jgi:hypothetical protein
VNLYLSELRDYSDWVGKTAEVIHANVIRYGGWAAVFPHRLPRWASRIRNYFNVTPSKLTRLAPDAEKKIVRAVQRLKAELECEEERQRQEDRKWDRTAEDRRRFPYNKPNPTPIKLPGHCPKETSETIRNITWTQALALKKTLHGAVYQDETRRLWYQMSAGATIYHYGGTPNPITAPLEAAIVNEVKGQNDTPVFKMISPDGTGGSHEIIIKNRGTDTLVPAGASIIIKNNMVVTDEVYQGSYNYADAMVVGFAAHEIRDVKTHVPAWDFYVNPGLRYWPLAQRVFPAKDPRKPNDKPLAEQV